MTPKSLRTPMAEDNLREPRPVLRGKPLEHLNVKGDPTTTVEQYCILNSFANLNNKDFGMATDRQPSIHPGWVSAFLILLSVYSLL